MFTILLAVANLVCALVYCYQIRRLRQERTQFQRECELLACETARMAALNDLVSRWLNPESEDPIVRTETRH